MGAIPNPLDGEPPARQLQVSAPGEISTNSVPGAAVLIKKRLVTWDPKTGRPMLVTVPVLSKTQLVDIIHAELSLPYEDPLGLEPEFDGMSNHEVMIRKRVRHAALTGDDEKSELLLDRILGRPKQSSESVSVKVGYEDYLRHLAEQEASQSPPPSESPSGPPSEPGFTRYPQGPPPFPADLVEDPSKDIFG